MKKLFLLLLSLSLITVADAQLAIGAKAGLNINNVKYKNDNGYTAGMAYQLGLMGWLPVNKKWFIRPELLYSVKGAKFPPAGSSGQGNLYLHYISIPILADFPIAQHINMQLGPEFGFMTKASSVISAHKSNVTDYYQHFQWGLDLGASYAFSPVFGAEIRYHNGFKGLIRGITTDNNGVPSGSAKDGSNRSYQFGLYYRFQQF